MTSRSLRLTVLICSMLFFVVFSTVGSGCPTNDDDDSGDDDSGDDDSADDDADDDDSADDDGDDDTDDDMDDDADDDMDDDADDDSGDDDADCNVDGVCEYLFIECGITTFYGTETACRAELKDGCATDPDAYLSCICDCRDADLECLNIPYVSACVSDCYVDNCY